MCCVQGAIVTMTKALAKDLIQKKGIRVNAGLSLLASNIDRQRCIVQTRV